MAVATARTLLTITSTGSAPSTPCTLARTRVPDNMLCERSKLARNSKLCRRPIADGIGPVSLLDPSRSRIKLVQLPILDGSFPDKPFDISSNSVKYWRLKRDKSWNKMAVKF
ncbi:hypothetical protein RJ641_031814 [Dillenia turbinata]|uniref:Uncharacterized protein n=1 Tax=Dillenia turbinata TaxID=194707 RepID=A0AAN8VYU9_9MAGN